MTEAAAHAPMFARLLLTGAAGGLYSSVADLSQWALMLLGGPAA